MKTGYESTMERRGTKQELKATPLTGGFFMPERRTKWLNTVPNVGVDGLSAYGTIVRSTSARNARGTMYLINWLTDTLSKYWYEWREL